MLVIFIKLYLWPGRAVPVWRVASYLCHPQEFYSSRSIWRRGGGTYTTAEHTVERLPRLTGLLANSTSRGRSKIGPEDDPKRRMRIRNDLVSRIRIRTKTFRNQIHIRCRDMEYGTNPGQWSVRWPGCRGVQGMKVQLSKLPLYGWQSNSTQTQMEVLVTVLTPRVGGWVRTIDVEACSFHRKDNNVNTVSCLFLLFLLITSAAFWLACCLYCTKSGWRCINWFSPALASNLHNPPAMESHKLSWKIRRKET